MEHVIAILTSVQHTGKHPALSKTHRLTIFFGIFEQDFRTSCPGSGCCATGVFTSPAANHETIIVLGVEYQGPNNWQIKIRSKHG